MSFPMPIVVNLKGSSPSKMIILLVILDFACIHSDLLSTHPSQKLKVALYTADDKRYLQ